MPHSGTEQRGVPAGAQATSGPSQGLTVAFCLRPYQAQPAATVGANLLGYRQEPTHSPAILLACSPSQQCISSFSWQDYGKLHPLVSWLPHLPDTGVPFLFLRGATCHYSAGAS